MLAEILQGEERMSLSKASKLLRTRFQAEGTTYDTVLKAAHAQLIELVRMDDRFQLVAGGRAAGKPWYYVALA